MPGSRSRPLALVLAGVAALVACSLSACTAGGDDDAGPRGDGATTTAVGTPGRDGPAWKRTVLQKPAVTHDHAVVDDGAVLTGTRKGWLLTGRIDDTTSSRAVAWRSDDRTTWRAVDLPGGLRDLTGVETAASRDTAIAVGTNATPTATTAHVWVMRGERWKAVDADLPAGTEVWSVERGAGAWFAMGSVTPSGSGEATQHVWRSTDGVRWAEVLEAPKGADFNALGGRAEIAAVGYRHGAGGRTAVVWHSDDGRSWSEPIALPSVGGATAQRARGIAQGDAEHGWVAVGSGTSKGLIQPVVWTSADGVTWTPGEVLRPYTEAARSEPEREARRVVWSGREFVAYGGSSSALEAWSPETLTGTWLDAGLPTRAADGTADVSLGAALINSSTEILLATTIGDHTRIWANDAKGGYDHDVTDTEAMPDQVASAEAFRVGTADDRLVVVGAQSDDGSHPLVWTGSGPDDLEPAPGSASLTGQVRFASISDDEVIVWGDDDTGDPTAWTTPIGRTSLRASPSRTTGLEQPGRFSTINGAITIGRRRFLVGVSGDSSTATPEVWLVRGDRVVAREVASSGREDVIFFAGGCGGASRGLAYGKAGGAEDAPSIVHVIDGDGSTTNVARAQLQPKGATAAIDACAVHGDTLVLGGSIARGGGAATPATWTSRDGKSWKLHEDLGAVPAGRVVALVPVGGAVAALVDDQAEVSSVWGSADGSSWTRLSAPALFAGSSVFVAGMGEGPGGSLVVAGGAHNKPMLWTLSAAALAAEID